MKTLLNISIVTVSLIFFAQNGFSNPLSKTEKEGLQLMREEEKLAHDVYSFLYEKWQIPIFNNIAGAETRHFGAVGFLLETFEIEDLSSSEPGNFNNKNIGSLYDSLTNRGQESLIAALEVGAFIEELDIADLQELIVENTNETVHKVYQNLLRGSRNHLRAFTFQLKNNGMNYNPVILNQENFDAIVQSKHERGGMNNCMVWQNNGNVNNKNCRQFGNKGKRYRNGRGNWN